MTSKIVELNKDKHMDLIKQMIKKDPQGLSQLGLLGGDKYDLDDYTTWTPNFVVSDEHDSGMLKDFISVHGFAECTTYPSYHKLSIDGFYIHESLRGNGLGSMLMTKVLNHARLLNMEIVNLIVYDDNEKAKKFYEKFGFEVSGSKKYSKKIKGKWIGSTNYTLILNYD